MIAGMTDHEPAQNRADIHHQDTAAGGDAKLKISAPKKAAAGIPGVVNALAATYPLTGLRRGTIALKVLNQTDGVDCPGCAWPDPDHRSMAEFCENGAKAIAEEATSRRLTPEFFSKHSITDLRERSDYWLGRQGRITHPMYKAPGSDHYTAITWADAYGKIADRLNSLSSPDAAAFYTSGRTSNEAAFCYQLLTRVIGTNNLPDCSNMCHESSGAALGTTIGIGKGTVTLQDLYDADLVIVAGQNPGTNHPRMLSALEKQRQAGGEVLTLNPLPEAGLSNFKNPQHVRGVVGGGTDITSKYLQIRLRGDFAFFKGLNAILLERAESDPSILDQDFIDTKTAGFADFKAAASQVDWADIAEATSLTRADIEAAADLVCNAKSVIVCWAMGLTQHKDSVAAIKEIVNLLLMTGNIGRPGAGACPVRGHSNVQGDRTMGIWEHPRPEFLAALGKRFNFAPPTKSGVNVVQAIHDMQAGKTEFFMAMGGNFVRAAPDTAVTVAATQNVPFAVHVSTKLNGSHAAVGSEALILPTLVRSERDDQAAGTQRVTVEDSMGMVHASSGRLTPASEHLMSETAIVCEIGRRLDNSVAIDWAAMAADYRVVREHIEAVIPGFTDYETRIDKPGGFALPNPPRDTRSFATPDGKAHFTASDLSVLQVPKNHLILQTLRSHDQFNTTIYGMADRYRGIKDGRRVVFVNPDDIAALGYADGDMVDLVSVWTGADGAEELRRAPAFRVVSYPTAKQCAAAYFPEANALIPLDSIADTSMTPTSKSIIIRLEPTTVQGTMPVT